MHKTDKVFQVNLAQQKNAIVGVLEYQKTWVEYGTPYLPLILTIVGWLVVSHQNDRRERRKEIRELIKQIEQRVDTIITTTTQYYILDGKDAKCPELSAKIRYNISAIDPLRKRIGLAGLECDSVAQILAFKQAVTGGQFEATNRKKSAASDTLLTEVATSGFELVDKFEKAYFVKFPISSFWSFKRKT